MIYMLVKVFQEEEHADAFIRGQMFSNRLSYFKDLEGNDDGRADENEGAIVISRTNSVINLTAHDPETNEVVAEITISPEDLAASPIITPRWYDHLNLYCMYAARSDDLKDVDPGKMDEFQKQLEMPEDCVKLGEHAVVVINTTAFFERVKKAAERERYGLYGKLMEYYDSEVGTPPRESDLDTIFQKHEDYAYQSEFRFAIDTQTEGSNPIILDVGDISDIAIRIKTADINRSFSIRRVKR